MSLLVMHALLYCPSDPHVVGFTTTLAPPSPPRKHGHNYLVMFLFKEMLKKRLTNFEEVFLATS
jgi:hypothetical protein